MLRWIAVMIFSCSSVSMPRLSNACLVPQSEQMGVSLSALDIVICSGYCRVSGVLLSANGAYSYFKFFRFHKILRILSNVLFSILVSNPKSL